MARLVLGPIVSDAAGKMGGMVFSKWRGVAVGRKLNPSPANPDSADQKLTRASVSLVTKVWQHMPAVFKAAWDLFASKLGMAGVNAFAKLAIHDQWAAAWKQAAPARTGRFPLATLALGAGTATTQVITWTLGDAVATDKVEVAVYKKTQPLTPAAVDENDAIAKFTSHNTVLVSAATITATGLVTGTPHRAHISVWDAVTGELSKSLYIDFTTA